MHFLSKITIYLVNYLSIYGKGDGSNIPKPVLDVKGKPQILTKAFASCVTIAIYFK